jgi:hypothetical protein
VNRTGRIVVGAGVVALLGGAVALAVREPVRSGTLRSPAQPGGTGVTVSDGAVSSAGAIGSEPPRPPATLVTNEYAYHHPDASDAVRSNDWIVTSGSLFAAGDLLWSGAVDDQAPGPTSASGTDSAVLRAVSRRSDHADVGVSFALRVQALTETVRTPGKDTDGVHIFLHYQSELSTYYVSMYRRDGTATIKKKIPGGPSNGGTYLTLGSAPLPVRSGWLNSWHQVRATIASVGTVGGQAAGAAPGSVRLTLQVDGRDVLDVSDDGRTAPVITAAGRVGVRGDNCEFYLRDFSTSPLA